MCNRGEEKMEDYTIEIRAGEGGEDAKLFVKDLMQAYENDRFERLKA